MDKVIGIDLGTTNCVGAYFNPYAQSSDAMIVFKGEDGDPLLPSNLAIRNGNVVVGKDAKMTATRISFVKREIEKGRTIPIGPGKEFTAISVSAEYLKGIKKRADQVLESEISRAVITVPAHFKHPQKEATYNAGVMAGLKVEDLLPEPSAAAYAYGWKLGIDNETIMVYDLGGGTFDSTILTIKNKRCKIAGYGEGLSGDGHLGGYDFDRALADRFIDYYRLSLDKDKDLYEKILYAMELLKIRLCEKNDRNKMRIDPETILGEGYKNSKPFEIDLTEFNDIIEPEIDKTIHECKKTLEQCKKEKPDLVVNRIIMVGGSSKIPFVKDKLRDAFSIEPDIFEPDLCVAMGAAIYASNFGRIFENEKARIILMPFPPKIADSIDIEGFFKLKEEKDAGSSASGNRIKLNGEGVQQQVDIEKNGEFVFHNISVPATGAHPYSLVVHSQQGVEIIRGDFIVSQGEHIHTEPPRISQPIRIKTMDRFVNLLPAGATVGLTEKRTFYTASFDAVIRIPAYEGHYPLGELHVSLKESLKIGTPVQVEVEYERKTHHLVLSAKSSSTFEESVHLEPFEYSTPDFQQTGGNVLLDRYSGLSKELDELIEGIPDDEENRQLKEKIRSDIKYVKIILEKEFRSHHADVGRIVDYLSQLDYYKTVLSIPRPDENNIRHMVSLIRNLLNNLRTTVQDARYQNVLQQCEGQLPELEKEGFEACSRKDIHAYQQCMNELQTILSKLKTIIPFRENSDENYKLLNDECTKMLANSNTVFSYITKKDLPKNPHDFISLKYDFNDPLYKELFENLKDASIKLDTIQKRNEQPAGKMNDLLILLDATLIPLNKRLTFQLDKRGLLSVSSSG